MLSWQSSDAPLCVRSGPQAAKRSDPVWPGGCATGFEAVHTNIGQKPRIQRHQFAAAAGIGLTGVEKAKDVVNGTNDRHGATSLAGRWVVMIEIDRLRYNNASINIEL